jgi:multidrug resistance efflux pump
MTPEELKPIETPRAQRLDDFVRRRVPLLVWSVCAVIVVAMMVGRARTYQYVGLARAMEYEISSNAPATLEAVVVDLYDDVQSGDVVAKLNDQPLLAAIRTSQATIGQLGAQLEAARLQFSADSGQGYAGWTADLRRFQIDEEQRRLEMLSLQVQIESGRVELQLRELEQERAASLLRAGIIAQNEYDIARLAAQQTRIQLDDNIVLLAQLESEFEEARTRRQAFEDEHPQLPLDGDEPLLTPLREAITVETRRLDEIELMRRSMLLRSPVVGQVSQILCQRGQAVEPGEPILLIAEQSVREIIAYLDEETGSRVTENTPVLVANRSAGGTVAESVVVRVSPAVQMLPQRLWRDPRVPDYGRAVVIAASPTMGLTPGQMVDVKVLEH